MQRICLLSLALLTAVPMLFAGLAEIKRDMRQRLPKITELKQQKVIGEDNEGYLELRKEGASEKTRELVEAENKDRQAVYEAIAKQVGTTAKLVGRRRALEIREQSKPGVLVQMPDGQWKEKE